MDDILFGYGIDLNVNLHDITNLFVANKCMEKDTFWNRFNGYVENKCKDNPFLETCRFGMFLSANFFLINRALQIIANKPTSHNDEEKSALKKLKVLYENRYCKIWSMHIQNKQNINTNTSIANIYKNFELESLGEVIGSWMHKLEKKY
ncbi:unnamed protein product [Meloidogyne enterolobii]|uniref:Uncharacterized protein n=1 Tax=Meloidogyne enterolobii TaxID=390850 RepID=A0ACB0XRK9_MELEN